MLEPKDLSRASSLKQTKRISLKPYSNRSYASVKRQRDKGVWRIESANEADGEHVDPLTSTY